jgi:hypothetical protein
MALAFSIMAIGGVAGLVAVTRAMNPSQPTPPPPPPPVVAPPPPPAIEAGPIAIRDPDNAQHWQDLRPKVEAARAAIGAFDKATALPADDLEQACTEIFRDANPLAGEGHPGVRKYADDAKRLCDYDRSFALIRIVVRLQKASPAKSASDKRARCDFAGKSVKRLLDRGYADDEKAKAEIGDVGRACL